MSFADRDGFIWMDGQLCPWREAKTHVLTHTLHYGVGVFEGIRAYEGGLGTAIFRLQDHTRRLFRSARILNMKIPFDESVLNAAHLEVLRVNKLKSAYIRPLCFYGPEGMGLRADNLQTHVIIAAWEWGAYLGKESLENGIKVRISSFSRHHVNATMCKAKASGNYLNSVLALQEAIACGADEALLLDTQGCVAEGSGENFFMIREGVLITPPLTNCLEGITRETIMFLAKKLGLEVLERPITRDEVYIADEAFFTGTAAELTPIREIDGRTIGNGSRGPISTLLQSTYFDCVYGRMHVDKGWLSPL